MTTSMTPAAAQTDSDPSNSDTTSFFRKIRSLDPDARQLDAIRELELLTLGRTLDAELEREYWCP